MKKQYFIFLIIMLVIVTFAVMNYEGVDVNFGFTNFHISLALLLFISFALGSIVGFIISSPTLLKNRREIKALKKELETLKKEAPAKAEPTPEKEEDEEKD